MFGNWIKTTILMAGIVALFGGQWPHSTYMLPGGIAQPANSRRILDSRGILAAVRAWFEQAVIGGRLEEWMALDSADALFRWQAAEGSRERSALGLFNRFSRDIGLQHLGRGTGHLLSYGVNPQPLSEARELPAGFFNADTQQTETLDQSQINEHVRHSWFLDYPGGRHPWQGETIPDHQPGSDRYTWAKAPRYGDKVVQETRLYDAVKNTTASMRSKEEAHDYRYCPDPDLLPVLVKEQLIAEMLGLSAAQHLADAVIDRRVGAVILAIHLEIDIQRRPAGAEIGLPLQFHVTDRKSVV